MKQPLQRHILIRELLFYVFALIPVLTTVAALVLSYGAVWQKAAEWAVAVFGIINAAFALLVLSSEKFRQSIAGHTERRRIPRSAEVASLLVSGLAGCALHNPVIVISATILLALFVPLDRWRDHLRKESLVARIARDGVIHVDELGDI